MTPHSLLHQSTDPPGTTVRPSEAIPTSAQKTVRRLPNLTWFSPVWLSSKNICVRHISLAQATLQLVELLPDDEAGIEAFGSYLDQLTEFDREHTTAATRGTTIGEPLHLRLPPPDRCVTMNVAEATSLTLPNESTPINHEISAGTNEISTMLMSPETSLGCLSLPMNRSIAWMESPSYTQHSRPRCYPYALTQSPTTFLRRQKSKKQSGRTPDCPDSLTTYGPTCSSTNMSTWTVSMPDITHSKADTRHTQTIRDVDITVNHAGIGSKTNKSIRTHGEWVIAFGSYQSSSPFHLSTPDQGVC